MESLVAEIKKIKQELDTLPKSPENSVDRRRLQTKLRTKKKQLQNLLSFYCEEQELVAQTIEAACDC